MIEPIEVHLMEVDTDQPLEWKNGNVKPTRIRMIKSESEFDEFKETLLKTYSRYPEMFTGFDGWTANHKLIVIVYNKRLSEVSVYWDDAIKSCPPDVYEACMMTRPFFGLPKTIVWDPWKQKDLE